MGVGMRASDSLGFSSGGSGIRDASILVVRAVNEKKEVDKREQV